MTKWDVRFLHLAEFVSDWSKDPSTQTGAVIVRPDHSICSVGFNGFPRSMPDDSSYYTNRDEKYSRIVHCEVNALLFARENVANYSLYTWPLASCDRCVVQMIQAGLKTFVFPALQDDKKDRWQAALDKSISYMKECGVVYREILWETINARQE